MTKPAPVPLTPWQAREMAAKRSAQRRQAAALRRSEITDRIGKAAEFATAVAVLVLMQSTNWIRGVRLATLDEDRSGIDVVIDSTEGPIYVQVKNARNNLERHARRYPHVPLIVLNDGRDLPFLTRLAALVGREYLSLRALRAWTMIMKPRPRNNL